MKRKLLVVNQYYAPDLASTGQLAAEICESLAEQGFEILVVTGQPSYTALSPTAPPYEVRNGVSVHRISMGEIRGRERLRTRLAGYVRFLWGAFRKARSLARSERPEVVLTFSNPPFVGVIGAYLANRYGLRYVYVLHDIHPDILVATNWVHLPRSVFWAWERVHRWVLKRADDIIVLGDGMKHTLVKDKGVPPDKILVIPLWGRPELEPAPKDQAIRRELRIGDDELLLLYSGNMGIMHLLDPILDAAALIPDFPVHFLFVGDGQQRQHLVSRVQNEQLDRVRFLHFQPEDRFKRLVAAADACFVALQPGLEYLALPSKTFTFLSAGRPLISVMAPGADIARLVAETGCGWNVTGGEELARLVRYLVDHSDELARRGQQGRRVYEERFRRSTIIEEYARVMQGR